jgi:hypothetical protein
MNRPRRESRQHNGITLRGLSQLTFATKSARSGNCWRTGFLRSRVQITSVAYKLDPSTERILHEKWCGRICAYHECEADS